MGESITIADRSAADNLVPALTCVYGIANPDSVSSWLSYLSTCRHACANNIRFSNVLTPTLEASCEVHLKRAIERYVGIESASVAILAEAEKTTVALLQTLPKDSVAFLRDRFMEICGDKAKLEFWDPLEHAAISAQPQVLASHACGGCAVQHRTNAYTFIMSLAMLYGSSEVFRQRFTLLSGQMLTKYDNILSQDILGLYLWPIDFSFVESGTPARRENVEHLALLAAVRLVNPDVHVLTCANEQLWARDVIAWLDNSFAGFIAPLTGDFRERYGRGEVCEGGNIVTGKARDNFVLVAQGPLAVVNAEIEFYADLYMRDIRAYTLPDGFLWARNPRSGANVALDSIHIDTVINVVPADCTLDNRMRIIVDPCYFAAVKNNPEFQRFLSEQEVRNAEIVIVDETEQHLNLPNFSNMLTPDGQQRLIFNKDRGCTLPRLNVRPEVLVQPSTPIVSMASMFGCIRCATNMLPQSFVKSGCSVSVQVDKSCGPLVDEAADAVLQKDSPVINASSRQWVKRIEIRVDSAGPAWEFDEFSRTAYICLRPDEVVGEGKCSQGIAERTAAIVKWLSEWQGIEV
jgi:hypothetical protein